ncbi:MAG: hypothetical protein HY305_00340 [Sphingobacteriales bacterium]|nr:hypothetical protein [Sphingobacteriales bacterium]
MIQILAAKFQKRISLVLFLLFYSEMVVSAFATAHIPGRPYYLPANSNIINADKKVAVVNNLFGSDHQPVAHLQAVGTERKTSLISASSNNDELHHLLKSMRVDTKLGPGPSQPEMSSFQSVNSSNMVDLFSGDFSYNIPLMDVGGYPINIAYRSGITMDQEASWVGTGWNINPGSITRNLRGLPDDFDGKNDKVTKTFSIQENKTVGGTIGGNIELFGKEQKKGGGGSGGSGGSGGGGSDSSKGKSYDPTLSLGLQIGIFHNTYKGWGAEAGLSISGFKSGGALSGGLSLTSNTQEDGITITPTLSYKIAQNSVSPTSLSITSSYNTSSGMKELQISASSTNQFKSQAKDAKGDYHDFNQKMNTSYPGGVITFNSPSFTPTITVPYTTSQFSYTGKVGSLTKPLHPSIFLKGYVSNQKIADGDKISTLPAYGYLNYEKAENISSALLDFNTIKEIPYRESPSVPNIGMPSYTYDAFSITGEGTGGMFRPYRGDVGFVYDHFMRTKSNSNTGGVDVGIGDIVHIGSDINISYSTSQTSAWLGDNAIVPNLLFKKSDSNFQASYFRNPGEMAINTKAFYESIGDDDPIAVGLHQRNRSSSNIVASNIFNRYKNANQLNDVAIPEALIKRQRDKRKQVITYQTAIEATQVGFSKYIESYKVNKFGIFSCSPPEPDNTTPAGLHQDGYLGRRFNNHVQSEDVGSGKTDDPAINAAGMLWLKSYHWGKYPQGHRKNTSDIFTGRFLAPSTGKYQFILATDDGGILWLNDSLIIKDWRAHKTRRTPGFVNLVKGKYYDLRVGYYNKRRKSTLGVTWQYNADVEKNLVGQVSLTDSSDHFTVDGPDYSITYEDRVNKFRKSNHISQIEVLNADGRKYVYGIPVYNLVQKDENFSVKKDNADSKNALVSYTDGSENSVNNSAGQEHYFSQEEMPAYAHSFLLTSLLSPDYVDLTKNGITDDDLGDAVQFKYSKVAGIDKPFKWRAPFTDKANYNEGFKTYNKDDKGSYVYGEKELWYLHTIQSKNMVATFTLTNRDDDITINEKGEKDTASHIAKKLSEINLYNKADFIKNGTHAIPVKTVHFEYTYELCRGLNLPKINQGNLTLKKIWFTYNGNNKGSKNPYVFNYNSFNPTYNPTYNDRWGNYKDPLSNPLSTNTNFISNADYPYAVKDSALAAYNASAWT